MRQHTNPGRDHVGQLLAGDDSDHTGHPFRGGGIDADYLWMRMRRTQEDDMRHPWQLDVADILAASLHQSVEIGPRHRLADIGIRPIEHRKRRWLRRGRSHGARLLRRRAVVSTASMMA